MHVSKSCTGGVGAQNKIIAGSYCFFFFFYRLVPKIENGRNFDSSVLARGDVFGAHNRGYVCVCPCSNAPVRAMQRSWQGANRLSTVVFGVLTFCVWDLTLLGYVLLHVRIFYVYALIFYLRCRSAE